jgi:hypothetical protein
MQEIERTLGGEGEGGGGGGDMTVDDAEDTPSGGEDGLEEGEEWRYDTPDDELDEMLRFSTTTFGHGLTEVLVEGYLRREKKGVLGMSSWTTS